MYNSITHGIRQHYKNNVLPYSLALGLAGLTVVNTVSAQEAEEQKDDNIEKIAVTGTQIKNGQISEALAVSVFSSEDLAEFGIDSGDELLDLIPENGQNFVNEAESISGGVNAARGDIGAFNLRNMGTGNTLVLLNGRRLVNSATYQTEEVGGSFVPVNSVNSNIIPVTGLDRVEVLRDGASAIYGADAVAGVVNHVLKNDFVGLNVRAKVASFQHLPRNDESLTIEWGKDFNGGKTNVSSFFSYYARDRVNSQDDPRWSDSDFRSRLPEGSPWADSTVFRNDTVNSLYGQFDLVSSATSSGLRNVLTDSSGEFETYPEGDPRCQYSIGYGTCGGIDGQGTYRLNLNDNRDLVSELTRANMFVFINHEFDNGIEGFTELSYYQSSTNMFRHPSASFSTSKLRVAADNYWNPLGPVGSPNRLPDSVIGTDVPAGGMALIIDNYRFAEKPRIVDNDGDTYRFLQGFRGLYKNWDWEGAFIHSKATKDDITRNRVSNTLMQEALNDTTAAAYNPFSGGINNNIERALVDVSRLSETKLTSVDFKISNPDMFKMQGGMAGLLLGTEYRRESFIDDRDDRLDGTIVFTDWEGDTYPYVSDVVNSSPTPDNEGSRNVASLFAELQLPVLENVDVQAAIRHERFSDVGNTTVGKLAFGWEIIPQLLMRGSWSEAFRAPNLVTINEEIVARNNTRTDWACTYAAENGGDPNQNTLDCNNSIQRIAQGSQDLAPETSENKSLGFVFTPVTNLTITLDYWSIVKEDTIGLFGEENHTLLDLLARLNNTGAGCTGNPAVTRQAVGDDEAAIYTAAGMCPAGDIQFIDDQYANLDTRTVEGFDVGFFFDWGTAVGDFRLRYNGSFLTTYEQKAGGESAILVAAQADGLIPSNYPIDGFANLVNRDGNQDQRHTFKLSWKNGPWGASFGGRRVGDFYQSSLTLDDGTRYNIPAMSTYDGTIDYRFDHGESDTRIRFGVKNMFDERAPLADRYFGYNSDAHKDLGRNFYLDVRYRM